MKNLLLILSFAVGISIALFVPGYGAPAALVCLVAAVIAGSFINRIKTDREFLIRLFIAALLCRVLIGTLIFVGGLQDFFGGDALTYDDFGHALAQTWRGESRFAATSTVLTRDFWGISYYVAGIYILVGRNPLAVQLANAVIGAATAPIIYLCAQHIFQNTRVARLSAFLVAFFPSLVLWSAQSLKDGLIVFLLTIVMWSTFKLDERLRALYLALLIGALFGLLSLRFYVFYMAVVAIGGAFVIGMKAVTAQSLARQLIILVSIGLAMTQLGVLRTADTQLERYANLEMIQRSREDQARQGQSGFARDVDVSTTSGALTAIPVGLVYLLFAPFPWQLANLRQSITLPEMLVWWASFPLLVMGIWFTLRYRLRQALPILLFTTMLTLAYSVFQGNVGTAYRQRAQILVFYFIFVAVGYVLVRERQEEKRSRQLLESAMRRSAMRESAMRLPSHKPEA